MSSNMSNASSAIPPEWVALLNAYQSGQESVRTEMREHYVTKADLGSVREDLRGEIHEVKTEVSKVREDLRGELHEVEKRLGGELHEVEKRLGGELHEVEKRLGKEIGVLRESIGKNFRNQLWQMLIVVVTILLATRGVPKLW